MPVSTGRLQAGLDEWGNKAPARSYAWPTELTTRSTSGTLWDWSLNLLPPIPPPKTSCPGLSIQSLACWEEIKASGATPPPPQLSLQKASFLTFCCRLACLTGMPYLDLLFLACIPQEQDPILKAMDGMHYSQLGPKLVSNSWTLIRSKQRSYSMYVIVWWMAFLASRLGATTGNHVWNDWDWRHEPDSEGEAQTDGSGLTNYSHPQLVALRRTQGLRAWTFSEQRHLFWVSLTNQSLNLCSCLWHSSPKYVYTAAF